MKKWRHSTTKYRTEWNSWHCARNRCLNPNFLHYNRYGGRGITMDPRWACKITGFDNFMDDMGCKPEGLTTLERINNNGNYTKSNCKWESYHAQNKNKSRGQRRPNIPYKKVANPLPPATVNAKQYTASGETKTLPAWAKQLNVPRTRLYSRVLREGHTLEQLLQNPALLAPRRQKRKG